MLAVIPAWSEFSTAHVPLSTRAGQPVHGRQPTCPRGASQVSTLSRRLAPHPQHL